MRNLCTLFFFFFSSLVFADDISDFEIERISIGDSLLDYFNEKKINENIYYYPNDDEFVRRGIFIKSEKYDWLNIHTKKIDKEYIVKAIAGMKSFEKNIEDCYPEKDLIVKEVSKLFKEIEKKTFEKRSHVIDSKSYTTDVYFFFKDGSYAMISCYDWSLESNTTDSLWVSVNHIEFVNWLDNKAY